MSYNGVNYNITIGRIHIEYHREYGDMQCVSLDIVDGWNASCKILHNKLSLNEVHDLHYALDRLLVSANV